MEKKMYIPKDNKVVIEEDDELFDFNGSEASDDDKDIDDDTRAEYRLKRKNIAEDIADHKANKAEKDGPVMRTYGVFKQVKNKVTIRFTNWYLDLHISKKFRKTSS